MVMAYTSSRIIVVVGLRVINVQLLTTAIHLLQDC